MTNKLTSFYCLILTLLIANILFANIKRINNGEMVTYDYGIYQQAAFELAHNDSWNPNMSVRDEKVWNDHFMPILIPAALFTAVMNCHVSAMAIWEWLWFALFCVLIFYIGYKRSLQEGIFLLSCVVFSKGILTGLHFAVHPGVWSPVAWLYLVYAIFKEDGRHLFCASLFLLLFRESFAFCLFALACYYLVTKRYKLALGPLIVSIVSIIFVFFLRSKLFGPVEDFGGHFIRGLIEDPISFVSLKLRLFDWKAFLKVTYPFFIPIYLLIREKPLKKQLREPITAVMALILPYYFLHFLANKFHYQYGTPAVAPLLALMTFSNLTSIIFNQPKKTYLYVILLLFIASGLSYQKKFLRTSLHRYDNGSYLNSEVTDFIPELKSALRAIPLDKQIIGSSRITPTIYGPGMTNLHVVETFMHKPLSYDYIYYWKMIKYIHQGQYVAKHSIMQEKCNGMANKIILNNKHFYLAQGTFKESCYKLNYP